MMYASDNPGPIDVATQVAMPLLAVPADGVFAPLLEPGRRLLAARDGIYVEARSPALYVRTRVGAPLSLPYGVLQPAIDAVHGPLPNGLLATLLERARAAHPNEMATLVVAGDTAYEVIVRGEGGPAAITYDDAGYDESMLFIDAHSHGAHRGIFSAVDDASDSSRVGPHISVVFGLCGPGSEMDMSVRACVGNYLIPLSPALTNQVFA